jgi:hypothetical protein
MTTSDFVDLQLSSAGIAFCGQGASLRIANGHYDYTFTPGTPVRVLSSEWRRGFPVKTCNGQPILEVIPEAPAARPPVKAASLRAARVISPAASHTDAPAQPASAPNNPSAADAAATEPEVK